MMKKLLLASLVYVLLISPLTTHDYSFIDKLKQLKSDTTHLRGQLKGEALTDAVLTIKLSASNPAAQIVAPGANNVKIVEYDVTASSGGTLDRFLTSYSQYQPSGQPPQPQATSDIKI